MAADGLDTEAYVAIVALLISVVALLTGILQFLQQYLASATGYAKCGKKVMGEWARYTRRVPRPWELRVEVQYEVPVIFLAPPNNVRCPVPDSPIWYADGSKTSYEETRTLLPDEDKEQEMKLSRKQRIHTVENERASWVELLAAVQKMEYDSYHWQSGCYKNNSGDPKPARFDPRTLAVAIQSKPKSWDNMPSSVTKPYATTTFCHIIELASVLGLHWKEFSRSSNRYRAEGNGYILTGCLNNELGLIFTFQQTGKTIFAKNRIIPRDEIKKLCFGVAHTIFCTAKDDNLLEFPPDDSFDDAHGLIALHLGSSREIAETLMALGCNITTVDFFLTQNHKKMGHLFPVVFELLGMLGRTLHAYGSAFRMLPNPTIYHWNKESFSMWKLLEAYWNKIREMDDGSKNAQMMNIESNLERIFRARCQRSESDLTVYIMDTLHEAVDDTEKYFKDRGIAQSVVLRVVRAHLQAVVNQINKGNVFADLDQAAPEQKQASFIDIYFREIRPEMAQDTPRQRYSPESDLSASTDESTTEKDDDPRPSVGRAPSDFDGDDRLDTVWCTLVFRMLCWLLLHDFHKKDVQLPKSDLLGSRLPVFIV
ncbi:hypothetical protein F4778DRAFT_800130 [Xylariomycetidae sp. FL2044]|nr:hypothetical protein F4778DRAFT_800130 [Xylariomycetidae sp. FL2044]